VNRDREPQSHVHAGRVRLDRLVDEVRELGKLDDLVEACSISRFDSPQHDSVDEDVFAAENFRDGNPAPSSMSAEIRPRTVTVPLVGFVMPATSFSAVLLPDPLRPTSPKVLPTGTLKRKIGECRERLRRLELSENTAMRQRALERRRTGGCRSAGRPL
jgi:hypothetical protein